MVQPDAVLFSADCVTYTVSGEPSLILYIFSSLIVNIMKFTKWK